MRKAERSASILAILLVLAAVLGMPAASGAPALPDPVSAEEQYASAGDTLLYLRCFYASGGLKTTGTGFIVSEDGLAVTAAHVVEKASRVTATMKDGTELEVRVISADQKTDVAVVRLPKGKYSSLTVADEAPAGGAVVRCIGYPVKDAYIITEGLVSAPSASISGKDRMLINADVVNGMSGGPVLNSRGEVVGVISGSVRTMTGIHLSTLWSELDSAVEAAVKEVVK